MAVMLLVLCLTATELVYARQFHLHNKLDYTVWVGILGNYGQGTPDNGGFVLQAGGKKTVHVADKWAGRFWARTGCNFDDSGRGRCATGDCGNKLHCNGLAGQPPASLVEVSLRRFNELDFYDVSLVDGFNVPIQMKPINGGGDQYRCGTPSCSKNLNPECPNNLQVRDGNKIVACKNACIAFNTDRDCCRGNFKNRNVCGPSEFSKFFKRACPSAYSYAYDDHTSIFTCKDTNYVIIFG
ncbi:uncharacterized protein [Periplaneta americana]|uniref:uncharacterized protein isoform X5 n=1 Tax=Periplaneta americana TaxID=6978 RepID=UPI0037E7A9FA